MSDASGASDETEGLHLPLLEESLAYEKADAKPSWRGWIHLGTLPLAIAAGIVLIVLADGFGATVGSASSSFTSGLLFRISGT